MDKQLEPYGVNWDYVQNHLEFHKWWHYLLPKFIRPKGTPWYHHYTFNSEQEFLSWKEYCIEVMRKELRMTKGQAEKEFEWFNMDVGLKQNYNEDDTTNQGAVQE